MPEEQIQTEEETVEQTGEFVGADWHKDRGFDDAQLAVLKEFKTEGEVSKAYVDLKKSYSSGLRLPDNMNDDDKAKVAARMAKESGVPVGVEVAEAMKAYQLSDPPDEQKVPGMRISDEGKDRLRTFCIEKNVSPSLANEFYQLYKQEIRNTQGAMEADKQTRQTATMQKMAELHGGDKPVAEGMEYIKQYLHQFADGPDDWADFESLMFRDSKSDSAILLRALWTPAHKQMAEANTPKAEAARAVANSFKADLSLAKEKWPNEDYLWPKATDDKYRRSA